MDRGANLTLLAYPSVDAISEVRHLARNLRGGVWPQRQRVSQCGDPSGTNEFHGSAYEFSRNDYFNANNYFNKLSGVLSAPAAL